MNKKFIAFCGVGLLFATRNSNAQTGANQLVDNSQQRRQMEQSANLDTNSLAAPELYAGETGDLGPQSVLALKPHRWHLEAFADVQYFFTDNLFLSDQSRQKADVLVSTLQAAIVTPSLKVMDGDLTARAGFQQQWFCFGIANDSGENSFNFNSISGGRASLDQFDFNAETASADLNWTRAGWNLNAGFDYRRLVDSASYNEFYHENVPNWGLQKNIELASWLSATAGYQGDYRFTQSQLPPPHLGSDLNDRTDHSLYALLNFKISKYCLIQPGYRFQFSYYTGQKRDDYLNSLGLALYFPLSQNVSLRAFLNDNILGTDGKFVQNYYEFDAGAGFTLNIRF